MILIIDYGMGNLRSVANAFEAIGHFAQVTRDPYRLKDASRIVLPGVGAFPDAMKNLRKIGWIQSLEQEVMKNGKVFLGICLGMQVLASVGYELGQCNGLGWVSGSVERIKCTGTSIRVPHIGWNEVSVRKEGKLFAELGEKPIFYFVHSYVFKPENLAHITGTCKYGVEFAAAIEKDNIFATQFHPEKSQKAGLQVLKNFCTIRI